jgi:hypothetical protein
LHDVNIATGVFNFLSDMYILAIPMPAVARLQISRMKKIGVSMIFSVGGVYANRQLLRSTYLTDS